MWDPQRYLAFGEERARPFHELIGRVMADDPAEVVDLGCGPGTLTATLTARWRRAHVVGIDSSAAMVTAARGVDGIDVVQADIRDWQPDRPVDELVSNSAPRCSARPTRSDRTGPCCPTGASSWSRGASSR